MSGGWLGAAYVSPLWIADSWIRKQAYVVAPGAWVNQGYLSRKYVADTWLHRYASSSGATITVGNVPALPLAVLPGSALQTTKVNATTPALALGVLAASANAGHRITAANVPDVPLGAFAAGVNSGINQIANVTFTVEVRSTFSYVKAVAAQNVPGVPVLPIDALVSIGSDLNVAATKTALALGVLNTTAKANTSTRAVSTIGVSLAALNATVHVGKFISVPNVPNVPIGAIATSVVATSNLAINITATVTALALGVLNAHTGAVAPFATQRKRIARQAATNRVLRLPNTKRVAR